MQWEGPNHVPGVDHVLHVQHHVRVVKSSKALALFLFLIHGDGGGTNIFRNGPRSTHGDVLAPNPGRPCLRLASNYTVVGTASGPGNTSRCLTLLLSGPRERQQTLRSLQHRLHPPRQPRRRHRQSLNVAPHVCSPCESSDQHFGKLPAKGTPSNLHLIFTGCCRWAWLFSSLCIRDIANQLSVSNMGPSTEAVTLGGNADPGAQAEAGRRRTGGRGCCGGNRGRSRAQKETTNSQLPKVRLEPNRRRLEAPCCAKQSLDKPHSQKVLHHKNEGMPTATSQRQSRHCQLCGNTTPSTKRLAKSAVMASRR